jgi:class 3 adenylate cyclase/tetratricopeptide (TPR) repeat protein
VICPACGEENPDRFRLCGFCGTPLAPALPPQEVRKTVTIVFSDLKGSTAMGEKLDSEAVREVMSRYFDEMRAALERHGGTVEKYIGDAIMAVFGLPRLHEDDALRAVRAAAEMRDTLAELNEELDQRWGVTVGNRTGVNTGEVVAGDPTTGQRLVTGDTVNTAARLEQAAPTNEVLLGDATYRLVRHAVEVEPVEPLELKGKAERVPAYRLVSALAAESVQRRHDSPLVGRERELGVLEGELEAAAGGRVCRLVTVTAQAGVGKSRLIEEFGRLASPGARMVRGRCLPYGRGITFWPLVEIVRDAAGIHDEDAPEEIHAKLSELAGPDAEDVVPRIASAIGLAEADFPLDEVFWGTRKLFEVEAARQTLIVVFEDIHWAENAFLDLIEHVAATSAGAPLLLLCATRPDLLERRTDWLQDERQVIELEPLSDDESALIARNLLGDAAIPEEARDRIVAAAEGNPLFVEQLLSMLIDDGLLRQEAGRWVPSGDLSELAIPPTIQALLAARLDLLSAEERAVIEPASVIGLAFEQPPVEELVPEPVRQDVGGHLVSMTQKQLVRQQPEIAERSYRFHHILVRDAAYQGILKRARASLHERFADWAEQINRERHREAEFEEILGYHLEQAHQYLSELGPVDDHGLGLGRRGAAHLSVAGRRAFARGDMAAAANLLRRAVALLPERDPTRLAVLPDLGEAMMETGEFAWAELFLDEAIRGATELGDEGLRADALLTSLLVRHHVATDLGAFRAEVERTTAELIPALERREAHTELATAWRMIAFTHAAVCRWEAAATAAGRAVEHARLAGNKRLESRLSGAYSQALCDSPTPVRAAIAACEEMLARDLHHKQSEAMIINSLSCLVGLDGDFDRARTLYREARAILEDVGARVLAASTSFMLARVEMLAGAPEAAEVDLRHDYEQLEAMGEIYFRTSIGAMLAQALYEQGRVDEAETFAIEAQRLAAGDDIEVDCLCRSVLGKVLAYRGEFAEAVRLAEGAVSRIPGVEAPLMRTDALIDLAEVLSAAGNTDRARAALEQARDLAVLKEMAVPLKRVDILLDGLGRKPAQPVV